MDQAAIDALRTRVIPPRGHVIGGRVEGGGETLDVISPIDGSVLTQIARGGAREVAQATAAARHAFTSRIWAGQPPAARKKVLTRLAELIEGEALDLAVQGVRDNGTEISMAFKAESGSAAGTFRYYAEALDKVYGEIAPTAGDILGLVHKEPVGVVGAILPWNFPLMIGAWKIAPALAMGNSIVVKPAESASLSILRLAELALEAGLPEGVFNVVTGKGSEVGEAMGLSMEIDILVFTGSGAVGRRLLEYSARSNLKRCYLELGGKSPNVVFADVADLDHAAKVSAAGIFRNSGQVCVAGSRLIVERSIHDEFVDALCRHASALRVGDPLDLGSTVGAVHSVAQLEQNLRFVETALAEGADCALGGKRILEETGGYYMQPTVMTGVTRDATLNQQEVFGPVLAVSAFDTEGEAVDLANSTVYGLASGLWTSDLGRAHRMVRAIRAGVVHVNTYGGADGTVPLGGVGQSGNGHDKSLHALDKYVDLKTAWMQL
ncbi:aldehyde dehydrogenase family protein (plasmid) [Ruegeria pomeroyi DSS-3]|uniref:Aldehyde dehydrogenase family protein n=2 Tax=Ruegeria pomeroyi TaxID=89184 RepID=Q5LKM8_RUEPO|nr:aldehyde dehydrogenase family protein [Ruegeria pomeroyi]AAV97485.1 aldehyde dehydrogenase family protein [Ruegeria pomeroyi DSS-3]NVK97818.1 aldehyde dehydrogenase family protein [Ruegeria pomeroyi]NVL02522.1 aldehyde dehydrogenase family protein [Ruegeria pomeroyi]HCE71844.1 aldehyde dehydrogenase [Ruegeria sp.]